jgi:hypothetical protein
VRDPRRQLTDRLELLRHAQLQLHPLTVGLEPLALGDVRQGAVEPDDAAVAAADRLPAVADPRLLAVRADDAIGE